MTETEGIPGNVVAMMTKAEQSMDDLLDDCLASPPGSPQRAPPVQMVQSLPPEPIPQSSAFSAPPQVPIQPVPSFPQQQPRLQQQQMPPPAPVAVAASTIAFPQPPPIEPIDMRADAPVEMPVEMPATMPTVTPNTTPNAKAYAPMAASRGPLPPKGAVSSRSHIPTSQRSTTSSGRRKGNASTSKLRRPTASSRLKASASKSSSSSYAYTTPKSTADRSRDSRLPTVRGGGGGSVFDRLYKTPTAASKGWNSSAGHSTISSNYYTTPRRYDQTPKAKLDDSDLQVFSRLYVSETASTSSKRNRIRPPTHTTRLQQPKRTFRGNKHTAISTGVLVYSPRMKPKTKLLCKSKYHPGLDGYEEIMPIKLGYTFFQSFCDFEAGKLDPQTLAKEIIQAFFKKDFPVERHWDLQEPTVSQRVSEPNAFDVRMVATYHELGEDQAATGMGIVRYADTPKQVRVDNYSYSVRRR